MKIEPLFDQVLIARRDAERKTDSGIWIPDMAQETPLDAEVIAVGPGRQTDDGDYVKLAVKPGDRVICNRHTGSKIVVDGKEFTLLYQRDIYAKVKE